MVHALVPHCMQVKQPSRTSVRALHSGQNSRTYTPTEQTKILDLHTSERSHAHLAPAARLRQLSDGLGVGRSDGGFLHGHSHSHILRTHESENESQRAHITRTHTCRMRSFFGGVTLVPSSATVRSLRRGSGVSSSMRSVASSSPAPPASKSVSSSLLSAAAAAASCMTYASDKSSQVENETCLGLVLAEVELRCRLPSR